MISSNVEHLQSILYLCYKRSEVEIGRGTTLTGKGESHVCDLNNFTVLSIVSNYWICRKVIIIKI